MKKTRLLVMLFAVMFLWFVHEPMKARAETYVYNATDGWHYDDETTGESIYIDTPPQNLTQEDEVRLYGEPDAECIEYLANLTGTLESIDSNVVIQVGTVGNDLTINNINTAKLVSGSVINANVGTLTSDVEYGEGYSYSECTVNGNVEVLSLGNRRILYTAEEERINSDTLIINGNVENVIWTKNRAEIDVCEESFMGNVTISGTVTSGKIFEAYYNEAIQNYVLIQTGKINQCDTGVFCVTGGELSGGVTVTPVETEFPKYSYYYMIMYDKYTKWIVNEDANTHDVVEVSTDVELLDGDGIVIDYQTNPFVIDINPGYLHIGNGDITVNGDILSDGKLNDDKPNLLINNCWFVDVNAVMNGDVLGDAVIENYTDLHLMNVTINGKITQGKYYEDSNFLGYFSCENVKLIENNVWNENVMLKTSLDDSGIDFEVVDKDIVADAIGDTGIGQEVIDGETTIIKDAIASLEQTTPEIIEEIGGQNVFIELLIKIIEEIEETLGKTMEAEAICGVDISVDTFYREKDTGEIYTKNEAYGKENISELPEGKTIEFTVKVPKKHYKDGAKYVVVRQHTNGDGTVQMEQLETTQTGDTLVFSSDKFSTFVIVEVTEKEDVTPENPPVSSPVTPPSESTQPTGPNVPQTPTQPQTPATSQTATQEEVVEEKATIMYKVQRRDNLYKIARMYGLTLNQLLKLNPEIQNPNLIYAGQMLIVGYEGNSSDLENDTDAKYYIVKRGDNLYRIAAMHNMSLGRLQSMNPQIFMQRYIYAGQKIRIN